MSNQTFNPGDTVRLKPKNSPEMVVERVSTIGGVTKVWTAWFSGKKRETAGFAPEALVKFDEASD